MTIFKAFMQFCLHLPGKETTLLPLEIVTSCLEMKAKDVSVVHDFSKLIEKRGICQIDRSSAVTHNFYKYSCADYYSTGWVNLRPYFEKTVQSDI